MEVLPPFIGKKRKQHAPCPFLKMTVNRASTILGLVSLVIKKLLCSGYA